MENEDGWSDDDENDDDDDVNDDDDDSGGKVMSCRHSWQMANVSMKFPFCQNFLIFC